MFHYSKEQLESRVDQLKEVLFQRGDIKQYCIDEAVRYVEQALLVVERRAVDRKVKERSQFHHEGVGV